MSDAVLNSKRKQQILAEIVRAYIDSGEPVSSRAVSRSHAHAESLSTATIRNVMADLEDEGFLYQPHTSAGRVPTAAAYQFFAQIIAAQARLDPGDQQWIRAELAAAATPEEVTERAGHILAKMSQGLGIVVSPPLGRTALEHIHFTLLPDGRVVAVLVTTAGATRDKIVRPEQNYTQGDLDRTAEYLNRSYTGRTLDAIRADLLSKLANERERYNRLVRDALALCDPGVLGEGDAREIYVEGASQIASAPELAGQGQMRDLLAAIEEREKLVALLSTCIDAPEPVHVQIGVKEMLAAGEHLALISAPYGGGEEGQGSLGVLGPVRMHYERAITAVAFVARAFSETMRRESED